jgi:hypothetical protein
MKICVIKHLALTLVLAMIGTAALAAVPPEQANFDAAKMESFRRKNQKYTSVEQEGKTPGPWQLGSFADGAVSEAALVADAGDGKPAIRMFNVSGQASAMFKPWTQVTVGRGTWEARAEYRKDGKASGRLSVDGADVKTGIELSPTAGVFKAVALPIEAIKESNLNLAFQLYGGTGPQEALYIRSFNLVRVGDVSAATLAAEQQALVAKNAEAEAVAKREAARRVAERKPIGKWVRPEAKPVRMTKPLDPPPVTGKTVLRGTHRQQRRWRWLAGQAVEVDSARHEPVAARRPPLYPWRRVSREHVEVPPQRQARRLHHRRGLSRRDGESYQLQRHRDIQPRRWQPLGRH